MIHMSVEQEKLNRLMSNNANNSSSTVLNPIETGLIIQQHTPLLTAQSLVCLPTNSGAKTEEVEQEVKEKEKLRHKQQLNNSMDNCLSNSSSNAALSKLDNSRCQTTDERESSPGIGFVIAAENGCSD
ncbi:hypothetical protein Tsp_15959, partial [Trichinella spiralis]|uniref:hypothetical protein n=1 Tax=Trichinella spiralis TaxID=6334 RepID=UPI0001EFD8D0